MFVTIGNIAQYLPGVSGEIMLSNPVARIATATEAAECINRMAMNANPLMHSANEDFKRLYRSNYHNTGSDTELSAPEVLQPLPNKAMSGYNVAESLGTFEVCDTFSHLFNDKGEVL